MGYFVKSLILHIFVGIVFYTASYISFKNKSTLTNVSLISASELKQKQAEFKKQEQEIQKQKVIKEQEEKKVEQEKAKKQPQPKKEKPKEEPKKAKKEEKKPKPRQEAKSKEPEKQTESRKSVKGPKTAVSEEVNPLPVVKPTVVSKTLSGEISGNFDFDAMAATPEPQVAEEPKQEEKPIVQEIEQEDARQTEELNAYLDSWVEESKASASLSSASSINKEVGLTADEYNLLVAQIKSCWFFRGNAQTDDTSLNVQLRLQMNRDATVRNVRVIGDYKTETRQVLLRHARNALENPSCIPLKLPLNKYEIWKETTIIFSN